MGACGFPHLSGFTDHTNIEDQKNGGMEVWKNRDPPFRFHKQGHGFLCPFYLYLSTSQSSPSLTVANCFNITAPGKLGDIPIPIAKIRPLPVAY